MNPELKLIKPGEVRVRYAPSPTGLFHIGSARTALFNYLFAKKYKGSFILRIEDTDVERSKPEFEKNIIEGLKWLGIDWTEGPDAEGKHGPYRQSERTEIYSKYLKQLLKEKKAYYCFCSEEELEVQRQYLMSIGQSPRYSGKCAKLSEKEAKKYLTEGKPSVIRLKTPLQKIKFLDLIRGKIEFDSGLIGDIVIAKNEKSPLFILAGVIDDYEMKISHVIRGEDHISNTPKQILLQKALGLPQPKYAHLPLILGPDRAKLSKRHGALPVSDYQKVGYLPEAIINFIAFLGWNPGDEREFFNINSLIKEFSLEGVQKGGAVFNIQRLDFLNGFYIRQASLDRLTKLCLPYLIKSGLIKPALESELNSHYKEETLTHFYGIPETGEKISFDYLKKVIAIHQQRLKKLSEISELIDFFFKEKLSYPRNLLRWQNMEDAELFQTLDKLEEILSKITTEEWNSKNLESILLSEAEKIHHGKSRGYLLWPLRAALTGKEASVGPFEITEILGKEKTLKRIKEAKNILHE